ncbi:ribosome maturation factor RimP [Halomonas sp. PR-M31]|uniref:ribosome maturation factor RimP n=1 Tax=Halomonas sp. PR-M31 TaxID=1471202 RepID=UPI000650B6CB|nr:ribosome maturation factor RimP [Halomonas sp. PR-M31]
MAIKDVALKALIEPAIMAMGFELWGVERTAQGRHSRLVIYIDSPDGVTVDHCAEVSRQVSAILDVEDPIPGQYQLEVSSPGMDRPLFTLEQFERYKGNNVALRLRVPYDGRRKFKGLLAGIENDEVLLHLEGEEYCFPIDGIEQARVVPQFDT